MPSLLLQLKSVHVANAPTSADHSCAHALTTPAWLRFSTGNARTRRARAARARRDLRSCAHFSVGKLASRMIVESRATSTTDLMPVGAVVGVVGREHTLDRAHTCFVDGNNVAKLARTAGLVRSAAQRHASVRTLFATFCAMSAIFIVLPKAGKWWPGTAYQWLRCLTIEGVQGTPRVLVTQGLAGADRVPRDAIEERIVLVTIAAGYDVEVEKFWPRSGPGLDGFLVGTVIATRVSAGTKPPGGLRLVRFVNAIQVKSWIETGTARQCDCVPYISGLVFSVCLQPVFGEMRR